MAITDNLYDRLPAEQAEVLQEKSDTLASILTRTSPIIDPSTRNQISADLRNGTLQPIDFDAEIAKRSAVLREAVVPEAEALRKRGMIETGRLYERSGRSLASAATQGLLRTSELYGAQVAGALARGEADIYAQVGQERTAERARITGAKTAVLQAESQEAIAQIQADTQESVALIQASTTLSAKDKDEEIAKLYIAGNKAIQDTINTTNITIEADKITLETSQTIGTIVIDGETVEIPWNVIMNREGIESTEDMFFGFNFDSEGKPMWASEENIDFIKSISPDGTPWNVVTFREDLIEGARKFDLSLTQDWDALNLNIDWMMEAKLIDTTLAWDMFAGTMEFNIWDKKVDVAMFGETMELARTKVWYDDKLARDLQVNMLAADARNKAIDTAAGLAMWAGNVWVTMTTLGIATGEQHWYAAEVLAQNITAMDDLRSVNIATVMLGFLQEPTTMGLITGTWIGKDADGNDIMIEDPEQQAKFSNFFSTGIFNGYWWLNDTNADGYVGDDDVVGKISPRLAYSKVFEGMGLVDADGNTPADPKELGEWLGSGRIDLNSVVDEWDGGATNAGISSGLSPEDYNPISTEDIEEITGKADIEDIYKTAEGLAPEDVLPETPDDILKSAEDIIEDITGGLDSPDIKPSDALQDYMNGNGLGNIKDDKFNLSDFRTALSGKQRTTMSKLDKVIKAADEIAETIPPKLSYLYMEAIMGGEGSVGYRKFMANFITWRDKIVHKEPRPKGEYS